MGESFKLTILGQAKWILGMQVSYKPNGAIQIDQECKTLCNTRQVQDRKQLSANQVEYLSLIEALYLAMVTRLDINFTISKAERAMVNPTQMDIVAAKQILCYLCGTDHLWTK